MLDLYLTRGEHNEWVTLRLPTSPAEIGEVYAWLDCMSTRVDDTRIASVSSSVPNIEQYIRNADLNDIEKLNRLAEQIDSMDQSTAQTFAGALDAESVNGLDDVLRIAERIGDYVRIEEVTSDRELGGYLLEHGFLKDCPEAVKPYLDAVAIGAEYYAKCGGSYTENGYVLRKESAIAQGIIQNTAPEEQQDAIFKLFLRTTKETHTFLQLPATDAAMEQALRELDVDELAMASIDRIDFVPYAADLIPNCCISVEDANELALAIEEMRQEDGELMKYFSALEAEKPGTFQGALGIALNLDNYERVPDDAEEYGRMVLRRVGMDDEMLDAIDGYMDFEALGEQSMEEDGVVQTEFGLVRRCSEPFTTPAQGGMQMR